MYDFSKDSIEAEHADVTFKEMEDRFPPILQDLRSGNFLSWRIHVDFLLRYMQMIRVRSPQFFVEQGQELTNASVATVTSVDHEQNKMTYENLRRLTDDDVHDLTLGKMREEFKNGAAWMTQFYWQIRTTFDPFSPVLTSEAPLFVKGSKAKEEGPMTMEILMDRESELWFPLCWQAALIGRARPYEEDVRAFEKEELHELQQIVAEMAPEYVVGPQIVDNLSISNRSRPQKESRS